VVPNDPVPTKTGRAAGRRRRHACARLLLTVAAAGLTLAAARGLRDSEQDAQSGVLLKASPPYFGYGSPALAAASGGEVVAVFLGYRDAGEDLLAAGIEPRTEPVVLASGPGARFAPRLAADRNGRLFAVWSESADDRYDIRLRSWHGGTWGPVEAVTEDAHRDTAPELAVTAEGAVWVVWESQRSDGVDVGVRRRAPGPPGEPGAWDAPRNVSAHPSADREPTVAVAADGTPWVAWTSWRDGSYSDGNWEIYARALVDGGAPVCMSRSPRCDFGPRLVAGASELALAWIAAPPEAVAVGELKALAYDNWSDKELQVSRLRDGAWSDPLSAPARRGGREVALDDHLAVLPSEVDGEAWIAFEAPIRGRGGDQTTRGVRLVRAAAEQLSRAVVLGRAKPGTSNPPALAYANDRLWVAERVPDLEGDALTAVWVQAWPRERVLGAKQDPGVLPPEEFLPSLSPSDGIPDLARGPSSRPAVRTAGRELRAWYGNLHLHTKFSADGAPFEGAPERNLWAVRDVARLDFACLTDHSPLGPLEWREELRLSDLWNRPGEFVTLCGYEWSSARYGHKNVVFPDSATAAATAPLDPLGNAPADLWKQLGDRPAIAIPHHPSYRNKGSGTDWSVVNDERQRLVEIFQRRGSYEYDGAPLQGVRDEARFQPGVSVRDALAAGHHLGIIASPDHGGGLGLAGVWADELTRESIFEGLHARRTFGTTGAKMSVWFEVDGRPLGSRATATDGPAHVRAEVTGTVAGLRLVLVADGVEVLERRFETETASLDWSGALEPGYVYLRAEQADGHVAWSSPVWLE